MHDLRLCVAEKDSDKCRRCGTCDEIVACSSSHVGFAEECMGCGACSFACPHEAVKMMERPKGKEVKVTINGENFSVPEKITVKKALELSCYATGKFPGEGACSSPARLEVAGVVQLKLTEK